MLVAYWWKEVVYDIVLPVAHLSVTLHLGLCILNVVDVESRVVLEVTESHLVELLCKGEEFF